MKVELYSYFRSSCSYRVRIALHLKNIPFTYQAIHLLKEGGEHLKEPFLKLNPQGQLPSLKIGNKTLNQSLPIILYLDTLYPLPPLFPQDSFKKHQVLAVCEIINSFIQPLQNLTVLQEISKIGGDQKAWAKKWIENGLKNVENFLKATADDFSFGSQVTAADLFLIPQMYNGKRFGVNMELFPLLTKIENHCLHLPSFQKAQPENQPDAQ